MTIEEFAEHLDVHLDDGPYETVAGYVMSRLGRLGRVGDTVRAQDVTLTVSRVGARRITSIEVTMPPRPDDAPRDDSQDG